MSTIQLVDVTKSYGNFIACRDINLAVREGEFLTILGPSGSGKTTLLTLIAGLSLPTSGQIVIGGMDVTYESSGKRNVGLVFQSYALFPHMTVRENVAFPLLMRKVPKDEIRKRVAETLELVRLPQLADRQPSQLSGGQQQRVALARAIVFRPPVLLMDEPLGALDKALRMEMQFEIKSLQRRIGATVIYITHDQEEALAMADLIGVMRNGKLEQYGAPKALYQRPSNRFVASFIGDMNFIRGRYRMSGSEAAIELDGLAAPTPFGLADTAHKLGNGEPADLGIRPEHIRLVADGPVRGTVEEAVYLGSIYHYRIALANGVVLTVRNPAGATAPYLAVGDSIALDWDAENTSVFSAS